MDQKVYVKDFSISAEPFTTDEIVARCSGVTRESVMRTIRSHKKRLEKFGKLGFKIRASKSGQKLKIYLLNEQQATLLITFLKNTDQVADFKEELVRQFFMMKKELQERRIKRDAGKYTTTSLGDAIKERNEFDVHAYSNFHQLAYKIALGKRATEIKKERKVPRNVPATEYLLTEELDKINKIKTKIANLIEIGLDYQAIKALMSGNGTVKLTVSKNTQKEREGA